MVYPLAYVWKNAFGLPSLPGRAGTRCRIVVKGNLNNRLVEFEDGFLAVVSGNALRRRLTEPIPRRRRR